MATFGDNMTVYTPDTRTAILARHALYNEGSLYKIIESGGNRQMLVGCLTKDGSYGVIVSASLAQIETAAEVMRSVLIPVPSFLIALNPVGGGAVQPVVHPPDAPAFGGCPRDCRRQL